MNCEEIKELSSDYLERRLTVSQVAPFREHLRICPDCRGDVEELRKTVALIGSLDEIEMWPDFLVQVNKKIDGGGKLRRLRRWLFVPLRIKLPLEAAALVLVSTVALYLYHRSPEPARYDSNFLQEQALAAKKERHERQLSPSNKPPTGTPPPQADALAKHRLAVPQMPEASSEKALEKGVDVPTEKETPQLSAAPLGREAAPPVSARGLRQLAAPMTAERATRSTKPDSEALSAKSGRQATAQAGIVPPLQKILEVASENTELLRNRTRAILPELGGRVVREQTSEETVLLTIELPSARQAEFYSALKDETGSDPEVAVSIERLSSLRDETGAREAPPLARRSTGQVESSSLMRDDAVTIELRIRQKK